MLYTFKYFNNLHISAIITFIIISIIIIAIPFFKKGLEKGIYTKFIGYFLIFAKIFDMFYRVYIEHEEWKFVIPLNLCNIALILAGIYFINKKNAIFNMLYFFFPGAILAILLPNIVTHYTKFYVFIFIGTHILEIMAVFYTFIHLDARITKKGLELSIFSYLLIVVISKYVNTILGTNFMFVSDYILPALNFIKPINLYAVILVSLYILSMILTYLPFMHVDNDEVEEKII